MFTAALSVISKRGANQHVHEEAETQESLELNYKGGLERQRGGVGVHFLIYMDKNTWGPKELCKNG